MARKKAYKSVDQLSEEEVADVLDSVPSKSSDYDCPVESELKSSYKQEKKKEAIKQHPKFDKFKK